MSFGENPTPVNTNETTETITSEDAINNGNLSSIIANGHTIDEEYDFYNDMNSSFVDYDKSESNQKLFDGISIKEDINGKEKEFQLKLQASILKKNKIIQNLLENSIFNKGEISNSIINETRNLGVETVENADFSETIGGSPITSVLSNLKKYNQKTIDIVEHKNGYEIKLFGLKSGESIFNIGEKQLKLEHPNPLQIFSDNQGNPKEIYGVLIEEVTGSDNKIIFKGQTAQYIETNTFGEDTITKYNGTPEEIISKIRGQEHKNKENYSELKQIKAIDNNIQTNKNVIKEIQNIESKSLSEISTALYDIINQGNNVDKVSLHPSKSSSIDLSQMEVGIIKLNQGASIKINGEDYYINKGDSVDLFIDLNSGKIKSISGNIELGGSKYKSLTDDLTPDFIKKSKLSFKNGKIDID